MNYKNFGVAAGKTLKSILISCNVRLAPIATDGVRELLTYDEMEIDTLDDPDAKVAIFGILSDTDKTLSFLFAILMWQTIDQLCRKALSDYGGKLPTRCISSSMSSQHRHHPQIEEASSRSPVPVTSSPSSYNLRPAGKQIR